MGLGILVWFLLLLLLVGNVYIYWSLGIALFIMIFVIAPLIIKEKYKAAFWVIGVTGSAGIIYLLYVYFTM
jgi:hypothetical protein